MGNWLVVNWRPFGPSCEVPGPDNACVTVCPLCNAIWSVDNVTSGFPKKRRCNTGSFNSLVPHKRRLSWPKVRAYAGFPPGVFNVVTGLGLPAGDTLARHKGVDVV